MNMSNREQHAVTAFNPTAFGVLSLWAPRIPSTAIYKITSNRDDIIDRSLAHYYRGYGPGPATSLSTTRNNATLRRNNTDGTNISCNCQERRHPQPQLPQRAHYYGGYGPVPATYPSTARNDTDGTDISFNCQEQRHPQQQQQQRAHYYGGYGPGPATYRSTARSDATLSRNNTDRTDISFNCEKRHHPQPRQHQRVRHLLQLRGTTPPLAATTPTCPSLRRVRAGASDIAFNGEERRLQPLPTRLTMLPTTTHLSSM